MSNQTSNPLILGNNFIGEIKDVSVGDIGGDVYIFWNHDGIQDDQEYIYYITVNGEVVSKAGRDATEAWVGGLSDFNIVKVYAEEFWVRGIPNYHGNDFGRRAYIIWDRSTSSDVVAYNIYNDNKTGTVDYDSVYETVDEIEIKQETNKSIYSGSGSGTIWISGTWVGEVVNATYTITITSTGFTHDVLGVTSSEITRSDNSSHFLPYGIELVFNNQASDYTAGDTYKIIVGPRTEFLSDILTEGTWTWGIKAVDAAGNESTAVEKEIIIDHAPSTPSNFALSYDRTNDKIILTWTDPTETFDKINIYSNYSNLYGDLSDHIIDEVWVQVNSGVQTYEIASPQDGEWKFALSSVNLAGEESDTGNILSVELPTDIDLSLNEVSNLNAVAGEGGTVVLTWEFDVQGSATPTEFRIYKDSNFAAVYETETYVDTGAYPIQNFEHITAVLADGTYEFTVRTANADGQTSNTDTVEVTVDNTPPNAPTITGGVSS